MAERPLSFAERMAAVRKRTGTQAVYLRDKAQKAATDRAYDAKRGKSPYQSPRWVTARKAWLQTHPLCAECSRRGRTVEAKVVDHIIPVRVRPGLMWDRRNWQSLCVPCHNAKTGEDRRRYAEYRKGKADG